MTKMKGKWCTNLNWGKTIFNITLIREKKQEIARPIVEADMECHPLFKSAKFLCLQIPNP